MMILVKESHVVNVDLYSFFRLEPTINKIHAACPKAEFSHCPGEAPKSSSSRTARAFRGFDIYSDYSLALAPSASCLLCSNFLWRACLSASSFLNLRPVLLVLHQTRDLIEFGLQPLIGGALVQQLLSLLLESSPCRRQIKHLRQSTTISIVDLLQLRSQIAVELVHKWQEEEAKGTGGRGRKIG